MVCKVFGLRLKKMGRIERKCKHKSLKSKIAYIPTFSAHRRLQLRQSLLVAYSRIFLKNKIKKIAIWKVDGIGDIIICHPINLRLKKIFPNASIILVCFSRVAEVGKRVPSFDGVDMVDLETGGDFGVFRRKVRNKYDLILYPSYELIYEMLGGNGSLVAIMFSSLGLRPDRQIVFEYRLTDEELAFALGYRKEKGDYIVFAPISGPFVGKRKTWTEEYWQRLIDLQSLPVIVLGKDRLAVERCINLTGQTSINQAAALIKECRLFVGVVSGLLWLGNVFNKDAVVICGGFESPIFTKYAKSHYLFSDIECAPCLAYSSECPQNMKCMKQITAEMVNQEIVEVLIGKP